MVIIGIVLIIIFRRLIYPTYTLMTQCSPSEFYSLVKSLSNIHDDLKAFSEMAEHDISSELLLRALKEV